MSNTNQLKPKIMLASIIKTQAEKSQEFRNGLISKHVAHADKLRKAIELINKVGDGLIKLSMQCEEVPNDINISSFKPSISVDNIRGVVHIANASFDDQGEIENIWVGGLGIFPLMGEKHTIESFFKKIAPYLTKIK